MTVATRTMTLPESIRRLFDVIPEEDKSVARERIAQEVEQFLKAGGKVQHIPNGETGRKDEPMTRTRANQIAWAKRHLRGRSKKTD